MFYQKYIKGFIVVVVVARSPVPFGELPQLDHIPKPDPDNPKKKIVDPDDPLRRLIA